MEEKNIINQVFQDFKPFEPEPREVSKFSNILTGNYEPPAYIVKILLFGILEFKNYGSIMEKVLWTTFFKYKNHLFMIRDYKFGSWTIEGIKKDKETLSLANEIRNNIIKASKLLDKVLYSYLKSKIEKENFHLNNVYHKLISFFDFYEERVQDSIKEYEVIEKNNKSFGKNLSLADRLNYTLDAGKKISKYSFALILAFFSLLEFLLDVVYVFEYPNKNFLKFRKKQWKDRFKSTFPINSNEKLKNFYDEFTSIRRNYRNPLTHGLRNEVNLLFSLPSIGLVPLSYEYLSHTTYYGFVEIGKEKALNILDLFRTFLKFMEEEDPYMFYILYLDIGFSIPVNEKEVLKIKKLMTTYEDFKEYLISKSRYEDIIINRDF